MVKSCIKIKPVTANSERHNNRFITPKYCIEQTKENINISDNTISAVRNEISQKYFASTGQKMQKKSTPIREAVILLPDDDNDKNIVALFELTETLKKRFGVSAFQWHIHNDEGHIDTKGEKKYNYHAHIVFNWTDENTGKSIKLNKQDMSEIQSITASSLSMERGIKGSKNLSLNHYEYRGFMQIRDSLEKELKQELSKEQEKKIREQIKQQEYDKRRNEKKFS